jgi:hypothetical protein
MSGKPFMRLSDFSARLPRARPEQSRRARCCDVRAPPVMAKAGGVPNEDNARLEQAPTRAWAESWRFNGWLWMRRHEQNPLPIPYSVRH